MTPTDYPDLDYLRRLLSARRPDRARFDGQLHRAALPERPQQVASLYLLDPATKALRQLTFDQDSDNDPTVLNDGRVLYQRWEYSDIPHYFSRRRMSMNPDGTGQLALYGSNSWFPTAFRFAKPVPDHPTRLVGIISGHHDHRRLRPLGAARPGPGRRLSVPLPPEVEGVGRRGRARLPSHRTSCRRARPAFVQLIPGHGKPVAGTVCERSSATCYLQGNAGADDASSSAQQQVLPGLDETHAAEPVGDLPRRRVRQRDAHRRDPTASALFEPQPFVPRPRPPVIPDRISPESRTAEVHIADIYSGPGLAGRAARHGEEPAGVLVPLWLQ